MAVIKKAIYILRALTLTTFLALSFNIQAQTQVDQFLLNQLNHRGSSVDIQQAAVRGLKNSLIFPQVRFQLFNALNNAQEPALIEKIVEVLGPQSHMTDVQNALINAYRRKEGLGPEVQGHILRGLYRGTRSLGVRRFLLNEFQRAADWEIRQGAMFAFLDGVIDAQTYNWISSVALNRSEVTEVRVEAIKNLILNSRSTAFPRIMENLINSSDAPIEVRQAAIRGVAHFSNSAYRDRLLMNLSQHPNRELRPTALETMKRGTDAIDLKWLRAPRDMNGNWREPLLD